MSMSDKTRIEKAHSEPKHKELVYAINRLTEAKDSLRDLVEFVATGETTPRPECGNTPYMSLSQVLTEAPKDINGLASDIETLVHELRNILY